MHALIYSSTFNFETLERKKESGKSEREEELNVNQPIIYRYHFCTKKAKSDLELQGCRTRNCKCSTLYCIGYQCLGYYAPSLMHNC